MTSMLKILSAVCLVSVAVVGTVGGAAPALAADAPAATAKRPESALRFGTAERPFAADSPWNARPIGVTLGTDEIPKAGYYPTLEDGKWSTGVFIASPDDQSVTVLPLPGRSGIWDPDAEAMRDRVVIPRWPAGVEPASAADGHGDIVDPVDRVIHSFNVLRFIDGQWRADQYAWTRLDGRGWGEPGHYFQGARAAAVPTMGGLVRAKEIDDNDELFRHALAMSLSGTGLAADPPYIYPATSADRGAKTNTGKIPQGALLMLPPDFNADRIADPLLRKVARTLKVYGGYVVDRNIETPFVVYVEMGANRSPMKRGWHGEYAAELDRVRGALRQVVGVERWVDGHGKPMTMQTAQNQLSMRGPWRRASGDRPGGVYDTRRQSVVFAAGEGEVTQVNDTGRNLQPVNWARPEPGRRYRLTVSASGGAKLQLKLFDAGRRNALFDSGELGDGASKVFKWPEGQAAVSVTARSGRGPEASSVGGTLLAVDESDNDKPDRDKPGRPDRDRPDRDRSDRDKPGRGDRDNKPGSGKSGADQ